MSSGRTLWFAQDAARHRRGLMVELQDEFGPVALAVDVVLCAHAKEQNAGGEIRDGFAAIARESGAATDQVRVFMERANAIGWLDDLTIDEDGRRFVCRVSGWKSDQDKARSAWRKASQREAGQDGTDRDMSPPVPECPPTGQDRTGQNNNPSSSELAKASTDVLALSHLLASLIREHDPKAKVKPESDAWLRPMRLLLADRDGDAGEVERVLRWAQADPFWHVNILSPGKLREKFTQLLTKMQANGSARGPSLTAAPTRWMERGKQWAAEDAACESGERSAA